MSLTRLLDSVISSGVQRITERGLADRLRRVRIFDADFYRQVYPEAARESRDLQAQFLHRGWKEGKQPSALFSAKSYLALNPDVAAAGVDPLRHYLRHGVVEGRRCHPLFDPGFYLQQYPDVAGSGLNPLGHYLEHGGREWRRPHRLFDPEFYCRRYPDAQSSPLDPLSFYLVTGGARGDQPHPLFDVGFYLRQAGPLPDGVSPLEHYVLEGDKRGFDPHPLVDGSYIRSQLGPHDLRRQLTALEHYLWHCEWVNPHPLFDVGHYLRSCPDCPQDRRQVLEHYVLRGWRDLHSPHPLFEPEHYLAQFPEEERDGVRPLEHFVCAAGDERRNPHPLFDVSYYRETGSLPEGLNPLLHYLLCGGWDGRRPHPLFDGEYYLIHNPEVLRGPLPPLLHYLQVGEKEGRNPNPRFSPGHHQNLYPGCQRFGGPLAHLAMTRGQKALERARALPAPVDRHPETGGLLPWLVVEGTIEYRRGSAILGAPLAAGDQVWRQFERPLLEGEPVCLPIVAQSSSLATVLLSASWPQQTSHASVTATLYRELDGTPVWSAVLRSEHLLDARGQAVEPGQWGALHLRFGDLALIRGERYQLILESAGTPWTRPVRIRAMPYRDDRPCRERIEFLRPAERPLLPVLEKVRPKEHVEVCLVLPSDHERPERAEVLLRQSFPDVELDVLWLDRVEGEDLDRLVAADLAVFADFEKQHLQGFDRLSALLALLSRSGVCTVYLSTGLGNLAPETRAADRPSEKILRSRSERWTVSRCCHFAAEASAGSLRWYQNHTTGDTRALRLGSSAELVPAALRERVWGASLPHVAVVSILYRKSLVVGSFLNALYRQTYPGRITVVLVDDCSPDDAVAVARRVIEEGSEQRPPNVDVVLVENQRNLGNCASRNRGVEAVAADIYSFVDCDCLLNAEFVAAHVAEHLVEPTDVVVGPLNLETGSRPGWELMLRLEHEPQSVLREMNMQDDIQNTGFVNCVTRNLSLKRQAIGERGLFDTDFSYSAKKSSGFGWEDVELGVRLYEERAYIRFTPHAFSLHQTHPPSVSERRQIRGSAKNYRRLFEKHPDAALAARRWATDTASRILNWAESAGVARGEDLRAIEARFRKPAQESAPFLSIWRQRQRRLRVLTYRWHVPHQYEIFKLPHDFTLVTGTGTHFTNAWAFDQRPLRPNVRFRAAPEINSGEYDVAILHFDENVFCSDLSNGTLGGDWGATFRFFLESYDLPKVAVCHGTPPFVGQYGTDPEGISQFHVHERERRLLVQALADVEVVCNSWQAHREWQFARARVIWHGFDPQEFPPGSHHRDVVSHAFDRHRPHYRGGHVVKEIESLLEPDGIEISDHHHDGPALRVLGTPEFAEASFRAWVDHLGSHKVYLNTTLRSPMPRSRSEAMLCGTIPVSLENHDVSSFIRQSINGFYGGSAEELAEYTRFLCRNEPARERIAREARRTALAVFNHDRFLSEWATLLAETAG